MKRRSTVSCGRCAPLALEIVFQDVEHGSSRSKLNEHQIREGRTTRGWRIHCHEARNLLRAGGVVGLSRLGAGRSGGGLRVRIWLRSSNPTEEFELFFVQIMAAHS